MILAAFRRCSRLDGSDWLPVKNALDQATAVHPESLPCNLTQHKYIHILSIFWLFY